MILCHICCSVDSHFFLQKLRELKPSEEIIGYFYNPNIHPYSEYYLRLLDVRRSCNMLGIKLIEEEYDFEFWLNMTLDYQNEPEKGKRCEICFDIRMQKSIQKAIELGANIITTTLLTSPKKSIKQLEKSMQEATKGHNIEFFSIDFKKRGGTQEQFKIAKEDKLYKQDYCGCMFALKMQRERQERFLHELIEPISKIVLPGSLKDRIELYQKRLKLESQNIDYKIIKERVLNHYITKAKMIYQKKVICSYFLVFSHFQKKYIKTKVEFKKDGIFYFNRYELIALNINSFNSIINTSYKSVKELYFNSPGFEKEVELRSKITKSPYSLTPIVVIDKIEDKVYEIYFEDVIENGVRENLVFFW